MYVLQEKPDKSAMLSSSIRVTPLATLKDEYGGVSHIIKDDHCYVLINGGVNRRFFVMSAWWYREAIEALQKLPLPK